MKHETKRRKQEKEKRKKREGTHGVG